MRSISCYSLLFIGLMAMSVQAVYYKSSPLKPPSKPNPYKHALTSGRKKPDSFRLGKYFPGSKLPGLCGVAFGEDVSKSPEKFKLVPNGGTERYYERYAFIPEKPLLNAVKYECHASLKSHEVFRIEVRYPRDPNRGADKKVANPELAYVCNLFATKYKKNPIKGGVEITVADGAVGVGKFGTRDACWYFVFPDRIGAKVQSGVGFNTEYRNISITATNFELQLQAMKDFETIKNQRNGSSAEKDRAALDAL